MKKEHCVQPLTMKWLWNIIHEELEKYCCSNIPIEAFKLRVESLPGAKLYLVDKGMYEIE